MGDWCQVNQKYYRYTVSEPTKEDLLLQSLCIPTQTEIRNQLGSKLADVFFDNLSSEGRVILGLTPPLTVPDEVWINPDLRLKNKVRCKPVPEPHVLHQKAFTHQMILELGERYVESLRLKISQEVEESLKKQASEFEDKCNKRLIAALESAKVEADENCKQVVGTLMEHFDRCFVEIVEKNKLRMRKECQFRVQEERAEVAAYMLSQFEEEAKKRDLDLCTEFYATLNGELNALAARYVKQIDSERKAAQEVLQEIIRKYETMLVDVRSEMEFCSFVDICRAITEEKAKHERETRGAEEEMRNQTKSLMRWVEDLKERNKTLQEMATERGRRIREYEKKMMRLIQEFQKFINFALESAPAHAEYLLSMEKMMMKMRHEDTLLTPEEYREFKNCLSGKLPNGEEAPREVSREDGSDPSVDDEIEEGKKGKEAKDAGTRCGGETSKYSFNYHNFKYNLLKNFVKGIKFESKPESLPEEGPCLDGPKESESEELDEKENAGGTNEELEEYKQALTLVGENEKEHMKPVKTFLSQRMRALAELCRNDPEMVRMMLGRPKM